VVQCQDGRSQHSNRDVAWQRLRSRLYDHEMRKRMEEQQKLEDTKTDVGWGHQIRSYVLDNSRIKDLRTNVEIGNTRRCWTATWTPSSRPASSRASDLTNRCAHQQSASSQMIVKD
jgi:protein subunit release factor B